MAIEIKELRIKVTVSETSEEDSIGFQKVNSSKLNELKSEIVRDCTQRVLDKIKEKQER